MTAPDRGPTFDGVRIGRPATGALVDAGYVGLTDLPDDLGQLLSLHGVGPKAVRVLREALNASGHPFPGADRGNGST